MGLNYIDEMYEARNMGNNLLPKWAQDERLYNCEGIFKGLFREMFLSKMFSIFG